MKEDGKGQKLTGQQQRVLKLLFKFRFVSAGSLAEVMGIRRASVYEVLEQLVGKELVTKVYKPEFRIDRKPAYYYLSKTGVTVTRKVMDVKEPVVHALYKNDEATPEFINHCMKLAQCYMAVARNSPEGTQLFTKAEINRYKQFPKNRPDLYVRTPNGQETIIVLADDKPMYIAQKRLDEILAHSEDEGWSDDNYPRICFILKDNPDKYSFLFRANKKLESMGVEDDELDVVATALQDLNGNSSHIWSSAFAPKKHMALFE